MGDVVAELALSEKRAAGDRRALLRAARSEITCLRARVEELEGALHGTRTAVLDAVHEVEGECGHAPWDWVGHVMDRLREAVQYKGVAELERLDTAAAAAVYEVAARREEMTDAIREARESLTTLIEALTAAEQGGGEDG